MSAFKFQWVPHNGGPMPVSAETRVVVRCRDGEVWLIPVKAGRCDWKHVGSDSDIVAYRVVEVRP